MKVDFLPSLHVVLRSVAIGHKILCHRYGKFVEMANATNPRASVKDVFYTTMIHVKNLWRKYDIKNMNMPIFLLLLLLCNEFENFGHIILYLMDTHCWGSLMKSKGRHGS